MPGMINPNLTCIVACRGATPARNSGARTCPHARSSESCYSALGIRTMDTRLSFVSEYHEPTQVLILARCSGQDPWTRYTHPSNIVQHSESAKVWDSLRRVLMIHPCKQLLRNSLSCTHIRNHAISPMSGRLERRCALHAESQRGLTLA